ncbi:class I SAM-dependent methyltransferase [Candidatus Daviesbacteria bacterium]|nr:class I SAM-dependent methyltransferase [Candidatus Daviesbacteria bacterium]
MKIILDLGCGNDKLKPKRGEKVIGVDCIKHKSVDIVHNLEKSLPFPKNYADFIYSNHAFEHVVNAKRLIEECWRICKSEGEIFIRVPHYTSEGMYTDLTHKTFFSSRSLDFYIKGTYLSTMSGYNPKIRFNLIKKMIIFALPYKPFEYIVNINDFTRKIYEYFFCWIFPSTEIIFMLKPIKKYD